MNYIKTADEISDKLINTTTKNGIAIKGFSTHFIGRVIGQVEYPHKGKRQGVKIEDVLDCILNSSKIGKTSVSSSGEKSIVIHGNHCDISINPDKQILIQTNPVKEAKQ